MWFEVVVRFLGDVEVKCQGTTNSPMCLMCGYLTIHVFYEVIGHYMCYHSVYKHCVKFLEVWTPNVQECPSLSKGFP